MPYYEYRCTCGHLTTLRRPVARRDELTPCAACGKPAQRDPLTSSIPAMNLSGGGGFAIIDSSGRAHGRRKRWSRWG